LKTYWDTSGLINAAISGTVLQGLTDGEHTTRTHTLAEFYGILTGRGIHWERDGQAYESRLTGDQATQWLKDNLTTFQFIERLSRFDRSSRARRGQAASHPR